MVLRAGKRVWRLRVGFSSFAKGNSGSKGAEVGRSRSCEGTEGTFSSGRCMLYCRRKATILGNTCCEVLYEFAGAVSVQAAITIPETGWLISNTFISLHSGGGEV